MGKYNWFENHEGELGFTVRHTEGDKETLIAVTDTEEKAHLIVTMLNQQPRESPVTQKDLDDEAQELLKPYYKQNKGGLQEWVDYEDAHKVLGNQLRQYYLVAQLYDDVIQRWKLLDGRLKELMATEQDLEKQIELKQLSNTTIMLENRDLNKWKEEAMIVMKDIPAIGKSIGVPLGETIHDKILPYIELLRDKLFPGAFLWWVHEQGWHKHSSGEYYYKSKDFHQWPPDEAKEIEELKKEFKALYKFNLLFINVWVTKSALPDCLIPVRASHVAPFQTARTPSFWFLP
jgi:hypothetical protein